MKKYEVPVMKLHQLKPSTILAGSNGSNGSNEGKEFVDNSAVNTQKYEIDKDFDSDNLFDE
jgi:hypothetical protein